MGKVAAVAAVAALAIACSYCSPGGPSNISGNFGDTKSLSGEATSSTACECMMLKIRKDGRKLAATWYGIVITVPCLS